MALLLETNLGGDLVIDLDIQGSPALCKNVLKLAKARYYTSTLVYNVQSNRYCQLGDPKGDGTGGACIYGLLDATDNNKNDNVLTSSKRFLKSRGRRLTSDECQQVGRVVATEMNFIPDTIGSQFLITIGDGGPGNCLDGEYAGQGNDGPLSLGQVTEDEHGVLDKIHAAYTDASSGRPYADIRIVRALVLHDPFDDPPGMDALLERRGVVVDGERVVQSPCRERPIEEVVETRIQAHELDVNEQNGLDEQESEQQARQQQEDLLKKEDKSRAVVLEMLGDLPDAELKAPDNVLFVCKLNPITTDEDLELIFSRFDEKAKAEIIRDAATGNSLCYAFVEFSNKQQCTEAYFKMNNALVDDRRIKVDFSQSVAKIWDRFNQKMRPTPVNFNTIGNRNSSNQKRSGPPTLREPSKKGKRDDRGGTRDDWRRHEHTHGRDGGDYGRRYHADGRREHDPRRDRGREHDHESRRRRDDNDGRNRRNPSQSPNEHDRHHHRHHHGRYYRDEHYNDKRSRSDSRDGKRRVHGRNDDRQRSSRQDESHDREHREESKLRHDHRHPRRDEDSDSSEERQRRRKHGKHRHHADEDRHRRKQHKKHRKRSRSRSRERKRYDSE